MPPLSAYQLESLTKCAGPDGLVLDPDLIAPYLLDQRGRYRGASPCLLAPATTKAVSDLLAYCHVENIALIPQGGNTGLVAGSIPGLYGEQGRPELLLSLKRLKQIELAPPSDASLAAGAGATIAEIQKAAAAQNFLFPLSLASEGSCTVGGTIATNAGGVHVIRYGSMRHLVLGLEAVLPDGTILDDLSPLYKNNMGYDLKSLLAGSEGSLAVITKAQLKLFPREAHQACLWLGVHDLLQAQELLEQAKIHFGGFLSAFEIISNEALSFVLKHIPQCRAPFADPPAWHILLELGCTDPAFLPTDFLENWLDTGYNRGLIKNGLLAQNETQRQAFWRLRESLSEAQRHEGASLKHDIALPISQIPAFHAAAIKAIKKINPKARAAPFGHYGDGNLHYNIMQPAGPVDPSFLENNAALSAMIEQLTLAYQGSIAAEHGIGSLKRRTLHQAKGAAHMALLQRIKQAFDPKNILNPHVIF